MRPNLQPLQPTRAASRTPRVRVAIIAATVVAMAAFATLASAPDAPGAPLAAKQAAAARLDRQVRNLEGRFDQLQERHRGALIELERIQRDVAVARREVRQTRRDLGTAKRTLVNRALAIYQSGGPSQIVDFAASGSFSGFFDRIEAVRRVSDQDADVLGQVDELNRSVEERERALERARGRAAGVERRAKRDKARMGEILDQRLDKLASVNSDIRAIMAAQRRAAAARAAAQARETAALAATPADGAASGTVSEGSSTSGNPSSGTGGGGGGGVSIPLPPGSGTAAAAASAAMSKLGSPYVWAASGPDSFDCSGLVTWAFAQAGRPGLPHSTYALVTMGVAVPLDQLQVGDLVFSESDGHMGIWVGNGSFVHAPRSGDVVKVTSMSNYRLHHARRI